MSKRKLPSTSYTNQKRLQEQIQILQNELDEIQKEIRTFEALLHTHLSDLIVEEQELFILYKKIKKAKKVKRLEQKKRGKNYKESKGLQIVSEQKKNDISPAHSEQQKEKKRLYREAILHIHPDKFSMNKKETDIATEITTRLIEIYKTGTLETLQAYHTHIFNGNTDINLDHVASKIKVLPTDNYLQQELERIEKTINLAKNRQLYQVITEYENPLVFRDELKDYYEDRILKLKKRTRKGL